MKIRHQSRARYTYVSKTKFPFTQGMLPTDWEMQEYYDRQARDQCQMEQ